MATQFSRTTKVIILILSDTSHHDVSVRCKVIKLYLQILNLATTFVEHASVSWNVNDNFGL